MSRSVMTVNFAHARDAMDVHRELARVLDFPEYYGHNWDAFWDCISSDYPLPDRLIVEGLDRLESSLPHEAAQFLQCLADYNNSPDRGICAAETADSYAGTIVYVLVEAVPKRLEPGGARGAMVRGWLKRAEPDIAESDAVRDIEEAGWTVVEVEVEEVYPVGISDYPDDAENRELFKQACIDGQTYVFDSWDTEGQA